MFIMLYQQSECTGNASNNTEQIVRFKLPFNYIKMHFTYIKLVFKCFNMLFSCFKMDFSCFNLVFNLIKLRLKRCSSVSR